MSDQYTRVDYRRGELVRHVRDAKFKIVPADAIVIERGELPDVTPAPDIAKSVGPARAEMIAEIRRAALDRIALAEYLSAHPPVDEAQVEILALDMDAAMHAEGVDVDELTHGANRDIARHVLRSGWTKPAVES